MKKKVNIDDLFRKGAQLANEPFDEALWLKAGQMIGKVKKPWYATTGFKTITLVTAGIVVILLLWNPFGSGKENVSLNNDLPSTNQNEVTGNNTHTNYAANKNQAAANETIGQNVNNKNNPTIIDENNVENKENQSVIINNTTRDNTINTNKQNKFPVGNNNVNSKPANSSNVVESSQSGENEMNQPAMTDNATTGSGETGNIGKQSNLTGNENSLTGSPGKSNQSGEGKQNAMQNPAVNVGSNPATLSNQSSLDMSNAGLLTFATKRNLMMNETVFNPDDYKDSRFTGHAREEKKALFRYFVQGGGMLYQSWQADNPQMLVSPVLGGGVQYGLGRRFSVETGLQYFIRNGVDFSQSTSVVEYGFGVSRKKYGINLDKMQVLQLPLLLKYEFGLRHGLHIGAGFAYVLNTSGQYTEKQRDDTGWIVIDSSRQTGYATGINRFNMNLDFGYYYKINALMELNAGFQYGLTDVIQQKVKGLDRKEKFTHFQIQLRYYLK